MREIYWNLLTWEIFKVLNGGNPDGLVATDEETGARFVVYFGPPRELSSLNIAAREGMSQ